MAGYYDRDRTAAAGTMQHPIPHLGNSSEFLVSGWPYLASKVLAAGTSVTINLSSVSRWICVSAIGDNITVTLQGGAASFVVADGTNTGQLELKCTSVTLTAGTTGGTASLAAGLTNIPNSQYPDISTANGIQSNPT